MELLDDAITKDLQGQVDYYVFKTLKNGIYTKQIRNI